MLTGVQDCKRNGFHHKHDFQIPILVRRPIFCQFIIYFIYLLLDSLAAY